MTSSSMRIPSKIKVGFNNREGTYTGKLAYITYFDEKGILRKETSWEGWRNKEIEPEEFDNIPTSGFVLNKGVGGTRQSWGWNARNEYVRVYDPRNFEFEISIANLLFILQETSSVKGKGLEGEFVYAWDGKELILLPTCCEEYVSCTEYTKNLSNKIEKSDIIEGCFYLFKNQTKAMYLGRHDVNEFRSRWGRFEHKNVGKRHVFLKDSNIANTKNVDYIFQTGYTNIAEKISDVALNFVDEHEKLINSLTVCKKFDISYEKCDMSFLDCDRYDRYMLIKRDNQYYPVHISRWSSEHPIIYKESSSSLLIEKTSEFDLRGTRYFSSYGYSYPYKQNYKDEKIDKDDVYKKDLYEIIITTNNGCKIGINNEQ